MTSTFGLPIEYGLVSRPEPTLRTFRVVKNFHRETR
jgi:hypothetical protein